MKQIYLNLFLSLCPYKNCRRKLLLVLLLLQSLWVVAQEPVKPSLPTAPPSREQLFSDVKGWQDSLNALAVTPVDTARLETALDSLRHRGITPKELERKSDSLAQAFTLPPQVPQELKEVEARLRDQIAEAKAELTRGLVPEEAEKVLRRLEQAGSTKSLPPLPQTQAAQGLPTPDELGGAAKARAMKAVGDHFANHKAELDKARAGLDKYKGRFEKVESVKDMPKGFLKLNPLKGKPWPERVIMGTHWQLGKQDRFVVDLGPYTAWRFTDKLSAGGGFQYRLSASVKEKPWVSASEKVLGYFAFTDMEVYKGFFLRAHYEDLSAPVPRKNAITQAEEVRQEWVKGLSVGVGKTYTFYKSVMGYGLVQYNLLHQRGETPYLQPLQTKIGFFLYGSDLRRKAKQE